MKYEQEGQGLSDPGIEALLDEAGRIITKKAKPQSRRRFIDNVTLDGGGSFSPDGSLPNSFARTQTDSDYNG